MKTIARAFVVVLALTGAAAARISISGHQPSISVMAVKATAFPIPTCPLDDPNACGIGGPSANPVDSTLTQ